MSCRSSCNYLTYCPWNFIERNVGDSGGENEVIFPWIPLAGAVYPTGTHGFLEILHVEQKYLHPYLSAAKTNVFQFCLTW